MNFLLLPAYNEEKGLSALLGELLPEEKALHPLKVIVVDDGSTDGTRRTVERFHRSHPSIETEVLTHAKNQGLGRALRTGFARLREILQEQDAVFTMDADDTHPVSEMPKALAALADGADMVLFSRFGQNGRMIGVAPGRYFLAYAASWYYRALFPEARAREFNCGYRAYRGGLLQKAWKIHGDSWIEEKGFAANAEMLLKLLPLRPRIRELPLTLRYDKKPGESKMRVGATVRDHLLLALRLRLKNLTELKQLFLYLRTI